MVSADTAQPAQTRPRRPCRANILGLHTIVSSPRFSRRPAVVTSARFTAAPKHTLFPDEVRLQLTSVPTPTKSADKPSKPSNASFAARPIAAGVPEDRLPEVKVEDEFTPATYNNPELTDKIVAVFQKLAG